MATESSKGDTSGGPFRMDDLVRQLNHWLEDTTSPRKVIARKPQRGMMRREEAMMMEAARMVQDHGLISIVCKNKNGITTFIAERAI